MQNPKPTPHSHSNICRTALLWAVAASFLAFTSHTQAALWITGYYPQYEQSHMSVSKIDFSTVTHVVHFCLEAEPNGSLNASDNGLTPSACATFVRAVHGAGRQALICVGGAGSEAGFQGATTSANLPGFVAKLASFMSTNNYDGVDLDWEPLAATDVPQYTNFVKALRFALHEISPAKLLTVAAPAYAEYGDPPAEFSMFASVQDQFDQINIMTYDLSGPYEGWVTWFNSPIADGGYTFPNTSELVPSVNGAIRNFTGAGVAPGKLGIGLPFYGYIWTGGPGVTQPRQGWTNNAPTTDTETYETIVNTYYQSNRYHWDPIAQAAYLSLTNTPATRDMFISYDDPRACQVKISEARNLGLGGIMIWELSQDYSAGGHPLLTALNQSLATPRILSASLSNGKASFTFSSLPLASYRVLWATNLLDKSWDTLSNNIPGTGAPIPIIDPAPLGATARFYRIQTPP